MNSLQADHATALSFLWGGALMYRTNETQSADGGTTMRASKLEPLNALWVGEQLGYLEQLCLVSGLAAGHEFRLYSYEPKKLRGVPRGIELRDAAEVMRSDRMVTYAGTTSYALGSNFWRYEMLGRGLGYWVDLDILLLKPFDFSRDYVFGQEQQGTINTAVMLAPSGSALVNDLRRVPEPSACPEWYGPRRKLRFHLDRLRGRPGGVEYLQWGTFGPLMLTYLVKKHELARFALAPEVFYPINWREAPTLYGPAAHVESMLSEETRAIHLYNSQLRELAKSPPPKGSYIAKIRDELGI
jgi:Alpha 1,4-glycosyltransferase conserved region